MAHLGRRLAVIGLILSVAVMVLFGREIERALQARCVIAMPLEVGKEATTDPLQVDTGRGCQVAFVLRVRSSSVAEEREAGETRFAVRYCFPYVCMALDADGKPLFSEQGAARWDQPARIVHDESADASGGRAHVQHNLSKFDVRPPGTLRVRATLHADVEFAAQAEAAELRVYDNLDRPPGEMVLAAVAVLFGPAVMMVGVVVGIIGWVRARREEGGQPMAPSETEASAAGEAEP